MTDDQIDRLNEEALETYDRLEADEPDPDDDWPERYADVLTGGYDGPEAP